MEITVGPLGQNVVCCLHCSGLVAIFGIYCQTLVVMVNQALGHTSESGDKSQKVKKTTNIKGNFRFRFYSVWMSLKRHKWQETWKHHPVNSVSKGQFTPNESRSESENDQRKNDNHLGQFSLSLPLLHRVEWALRLHSHSLKTITWKYLGQ